MLAMTKFGCFYCHINNYHTCIKRGVIFLLVFLREIILHKIIYRPARIFAHVTRYSHSEKHLLIAASTLADLFNGM